MRRRCFSDGRPALLLLTLHVLLAPGTALAAAKVPRVDTVPNERLTGQAEVLEGDLLSIRGRRVRLMGIDAPDRGQVCLNRYGSGFDCAAISVGVLKALIGDGEIECTLADRDRDGLDQGECRARGVDLGTAMVARGWAFAYRSLTAAYQQAEAYAQSKRLGLWSGKVEKPWQWRSRRLREQAR